MKIALVLAVIAVSCLAVTIEFKDVVEIFMRNVFDVLRVFDEFKQETIIRTNRIGDIASEYDFIIVGSGSSGSVLANRLSEVSQWKVLLLEVGKPENSFTSVPLFAPLLQWTDYNWKYIMEPQDNVCLAMDEQRCAWPRGRALGGSSVINYMIYTRGNKRDYDKWAASGNPGWSYADVLPYFLKSEDVHLKNYEQDYHSKGGYLSISDPFTSEITDAFLEASRELGEEILDYNGKEQLGFSDMQANLKKGRRHSAAKAFLQPVTNRKNLHILTEAKVVKIAIDPNTKVATGVEFRHKGRTYAVKTRKEVIVSAGALSSPQLLMLSGIGPKEQLEKFGIPVIKELPVGQNLQDHISYVGLVFTMNRTIEKASHVFDPIRIKRWQREGVGPLASLGGIEAVGFIQTNASQETKGYPDVELIFVGGGGLQTDYGIFNRRFVRISDDYYYKAFGPVEGKPSWTIFPMLLHPKSRGHLELQSTNPYHPPLFYGNYFSDANGEDKQTLIESIRYITRLSKTTPFQRYASTMSPVPVPGCENLIFDSTPYWSCALERFTITLHHQLGTCKMGPSKDSEVVVDSDFKVYGVAGLRVVDTSVIPFSLSAHTNAPAMMIGEKAGDVIKQQWKL